MLRCPCCQSTDLKPSRRASLLRAIVELAGFYRVRCQECNHDFSAYWGPLYQPHLAKCPGCFNTQLSTWSPRVFSPGTWDQIKIGLGARRVRCDRCRRNFSSFRMVARRRRAEPGLNEPGLNEPGLNEPGLNEPGLNEPGLNERGLNERAGGAPIQA